MSSAHFLWKLNFRKIICFCVSYRKYEEAMQAVTGPQARELKCHSLLQVGRTYLDFLLAKGEFQTAARLCVNILG